MPHDPLTLSPERCFHADPARHDVWRRVSCDWLARQWWRASGSGGYDYAGFMMVLHKIGYESAHLCGVPLERSGNRRCSGACVYA